MSAPATRSTPRTCSSSSSDTAARRARAPGRPPQWAPIHGCARAGAARAWAAETGRRGRTPSVRRARTCASGPAIPAPEIACHAPCPVATGGKIAPPPGPRQGSGRGRGSPAGEPGLRRRGRHLRRQFHDSAAASARIDGRQRRAHPRRQRPAGSGRAGRTRPGDQRRGCRRPLRRAPPPADRRIPRAGAVPADGRAIRSRWCQRRWRRKAASVPRPATTSTPVAGSGTSDGADSAATV